MHLPAVALDEPTVRHLPRGDIKKNKQHKFMPEPRQYCNLDGCVFFPNAELPSVVDSS